MRISWVYGPPVLADSPARGPIPSYLMRAARGEAIREGGGDFRASFTWIGDVAEGLLAMAAAPQLRHEVYHLAPGRDFTARDVAAAVKVAFPQAVIELGPGTEPWTRYTALRGPLSAKRLAEDTGFACATRLDSAIGQYAAWLKSASR
ncbi:MAG: NAD(P)-dependent oxidoreductase [Hyphomicrobiaceae bacterium]|nr:MAG: NAD(P)-dependent oxidoreductase [Hyphomicrobiaceae bacterium]